MRARRLLICLLIGLSATVFSGERGIAEERNRSFCKEAEQHVASDRLLRQTVAAVFGRVDYESSENVDSDCIEPLQVFRFPNVIVLITNVPGSRCFACSAHLSAYMFSRGRRGLHLIAKHEGFAEFGSSGSPGKLTPIRFAGNNALVATIVNAHHGSSEELISFFIFRGGRVLDVGGPGVLSTDDGQTVSVTGEWMVGRVQSHKLVVDYKISKFGTTRNERVVWGLHGQHLRIERGHEPPELIKALGLGDN